MLSRGMVIIDGGKQMKTWEVALKVVIATALTVVLWQCDVEHAKPCAFGYCKGQKIDQEPQDHADDGMAFIKVRHRAFNRGLTIYFTRRQGVCSLKGLHGANWVRGEGNRDTHAQKFREFVALVSEKYGKPSAESGNFAELRLASWNAADGSELPRGLQSISVEAMSFGLVGLIGVNYTFDNYDECLVESKTGADF